MILVRKNKDYYDYLVGIYGRDENKYFDRSEEIRSIELNLLYSKPITLTCLNVNTDRDIANIYINGRVYRFLQYEETGDWRHCKVSKTETDYLGNKKLCLSEDVKFEDLDKYSDYIEDPNKEINCLHRSPIVIYYNGTYRSGVPILKDFGFNKVTSPEEVYSELDSFLGWLKDNPEPENKTTDLQKLESKGFDKKISFRHRK